MFLILSLKDAFSKLFLQAMPPTQVSVERLFSALKLQKSDLRSRIKADALDALLLLKANSDHIDKLV